MAGLSDEDMPWADNAERLREQERRILETGEPWRAYDEATATPDGIRVFMRTAKVPLRDVDGAVVGIVGAAEWINHPELAPMDLPDPEERLRALTENAAEAVVVIQDGRIKYVNARGREIFGATEEELVGMAVDRAVHPEDRRRVQNDFRQVLDGEEPAFASLYELRIINREGTRPVAPGQHHAGAVGGQDRHASLHHRCDPLPPTEGDAGRPEQGVDCHGRPRCAGRYFPVGCPRACLDRFPRPRLHAERGRHPLSGLSGEAARGSGGAAHDLPFSELSLCLRGQEESSPRSSMVEETLLITDIPGFLESVLLPRSCATSFLTW